MWGGTGAANLNVIQEVEYVKNEANVVYLLEWLQKTPSPVIIFCEKKQDVDDIHEYLLVKGVAAASIYGGKDQEERNKAIVGIAFTRSGKTFTFSLPMIIFALKEEFNCLYKEEKVRWDWSCVRPGNLPGKHERS